jgi:mono/diheme cytochrome c family protein
MKRGTVGEQVAVLGLLLLTAFFLVRGAVRADTRPGKHTHEKDTSAGQSAGGHTHQHDTWESPPPEYVSARSTRWDDPAAARRGEALFQTHCMVCHGADGRGQGPGAAGLPHAPADLTHHFHYSPGDGDAYLFWRVSEGGQVEPFRSMQSVMPAFKTVLTEDERWDVLAYVHATFHRGFLPTSVTGEGTVIAVVPATEELVVKHGDIQGFMGPMTMGYKVSPPSLLKPLKAGDTVRFTIDTKEKAIVAIQKLKK